MGGPTKVAVWQAGRWCAQFCSTASRRAEPAGHGNQKRAAGVQQMSGTAEQWGDTSSTTMSTRSPYVMLLQQSLTHIPKTSSSLVTGNFCLQRFMLKIYFL